MENFTFTIAYILWEDSYTALQVELASIILNNTRLQLVSLNRVDPNLSAKILYYIHTRFQAFLHSYSEAVEFRDVNFHYLDWDQDLTNLY